MGKIKTIVPLSQETDASLLASLLAYQLREQEKYTRIAVVDFDLVGPTIFQNYHEDTIHGLDRLAARINGDLFNERVLKENMISLKKDIDFLRGSQISDRYPYVTQHHLSAIIDQLIKSYDDVFVITSGQTSDSGLLSGVYGADELILMGYDEESIVSYKHELMPFINVYKQTNELSLVYMPYEPESKRLSIPGLSEQAYKGTISSIDELDKVFDGVTLMKALRRMRHSKQSVKTLERLLT